LRIIEARFSREIRGRSTMEMLDIFGFDGVGAGVCVAVIAFECICPAVWILSQAENWSAFADLTSGVEVVWEGFMAFGVCIRT
jgi:hypothetical protein